MKFLSLLFLALFFVSCSSTPSRRTDRLSILQGVTNAKEVEFSIVAQKSDALTFELRTAEGETLPPVETRTVTREFSPFVVHKVLFNRDVQKEYNLVVLQGTKIVDQRLVGRGQRKSDHLRLVVASCMSDFYTKQFKIWDQVVAKNPEYLLLIGDNVYADSATKETSQATNPEILWNRYVDTRQRLPLFFEEKLIPTHGVWDDHDYGLNNGGQFFTYREESKEIFDAFFAQSIAEEDWSRGYGVGGLLTLGDFNLYFLDSRSFRSKDYEGKHLGLDQNAWFISKIREENAPSLIIKGDQFFGGYHKYESFEGRHPEDFKDFLSHLKLIPTPMVFVSGDRHLSELMQFPRGLLGKPSFEITSSPIHSAVYPPDEDSKNPWRVVATEGKINFTVIDNEARDNHWFLNVENVGEHGEIYYRRELAVYIKDLQDNLKEIRKRRSGKRSYRRNYRRR